MKRKTATISAMILTSVTTQVQAVSLDELLNIQVDLSTKRMLTIYSSEVGYRFKLTDALMMDHSLFGGGTTAKENTES